MHADQQTYAGVKIGVQAAAGRVKHAVNVGRSQNIFQ